MTGTFEATRQSLHQVAEHVVAAAQYRSTGFIRLRAVPDGFAAVHDVDGIGTISVIGPSLVVEEGPHRRTCTLTTLRAAADFLGSTPGMPDTVYRPTTPLDLDAPLVVDPSDAQSLADWYGLADAALRRFAGEIGVEATPTLWPEHFDLAITAAAVNYGASPGDDHHRSPYLYIGPHSGPHADDAFWNAPFGASRRRDEVGSVDGAVAFFHEGRARSS
jgi:hypothetical protein